jgi:hypothetical protein
MTNYDRYKALLKKRDALDKQTKELEKVIFDMDTKSSEAEIQVWNKLELKRRALAVQVARQWQTLTRDERKQEVAKYSKRSS